MDPPYLEPEPERQYEFKVGDQFLIQIGEGIDPQGGEVSVDHELGEAQTFLEVFRDDIYLNQAAYGDNKVREEMRGRYEVEIEVSSVFEDVRLENVYRITIQITGEDEDSLISEQQSHSDSDEYQIED